MSMVGRWALAAAFLRHFDFVSVAADLINTLAATKRPMKR